MIAAALRALFLWLSNRRWVARAWRSPPRSCAGCRCDLWPARRSTRQSPPSAPSTPAASATLDVLGEAVPDRAIADRAAAAYVATIERIAAEGLDANVSIKLTQMGLDLGVDACLEILAPVADASRRHGVFVRIDMESSDYTDRTLEVVERLRADGVDAGPVIQAYSIGRRSTWSGLRPSACAPVSARARTRRSRRRAHRARGDRRRFRGAHALPARGRRLSRCRDARSRHDPARGAAASELGIGRDRFEYQMLYGVRRDLQRRLVERAIGCGSTSRTAPSGIRRAMRRLAERPANVAFVVRSVLGERA